MQLATQLLCKSFHQLSSHRRSDFQWIKSNAVICDRQSCLLIHDIEMDRDRAAVVVGESMSIGIGHCLDR